MNSNYVDKLTKQEFLKLIPTRRINKVLDVQNVKDAILCPLTIEQSNISIEIIQNDNTILPEVNSNIYYQTLPEVNSHIEVIYKKEETIIYLGCMYNCWGHFFTDGFSKVWYLLTDEYKLKYKGKVKIAVSFIGNDIKYCPKPLLELYQLLGIKENDILVITEPTKFKSIIVPDNSLFFHNGTRHFTKDYCDVIQTIIDAVEPMNDRKFEKIYLSRTHFTKGNADFGEKSLEVVFKRLGYTIIHPQEYSIREQLSIFKTAKSFVSTTGSLGHNSLFCNANTEVILLRKCFAIFDYQLVINEARDLTVTYIDTHLTCFVNDQPNNGPFFLYRNTNFCRFIKDRFGIVVKEDFSTKRYMRYMRICLMRNDMKNRTQAHEYYFNKLREELQNDSWKKRIYDAMRELMPKSITNQLKKIYFRCIR